MRKIKQGNREALHCMSPYAGNQLPSFKMERVKFNGVRRNHNTDRTRPES